MKCNLLLCLLPAACTGLFLPILAPAQILDARPVSAFPSRADGSADALRGWPAVRPPLGGRLFMRHDQDRGNLGFTQFRFPAVTVTFDNERLGDWRRIETPARYALEWTSRWTTEAVLGLAELPAASFPAPLADPAWHAYLAALRQQYGPRLRLRADDDSAVNSQMLRPLVGGRTRVLDYEIAPEKPGEPVRRVLQVFMVAPGGVMVAGIEGPSLVVQQLQRVFSDLLMSMEAETVGDAPALTANPATPPAAARLVRGG